MAWINEANWPEAWVEIYFSPIVKSGSQYIVYVAGFNVLKLYKYNLTTQTWTYLNTTPAQLAHSPSLSPDGTKLVFNEFSGNKLYIYNIAGNSWTTSAAAPNLSVTGEAPGIQTTVWTDNDTIWCHVLGGVAPNNKNKCYKYVVSTNTWTQYTNVYTFGPNRNSKNMSVNSAGTALFVGGVFDGADHTKGFKYVIATDTYSQFLLPPGGYDYNWNSDRAARLWFIDALVSHAGYFYYDCDTEASDYISKFPDDPLRDKSSQNLACGIYAIGYIIAWHKTIEPKNRSYLGIVAPTVTTDPATSIEATTATLNGTLNNNGGEASDCGFEWGETIAYGNTTPTQSKTTGQTFSQGITGLNPNKTYHFRAFATNAAGTSYGSDRAFSIPAAVTAVAIVQTLPATSITEGSAQLNGMVIDDAGFPGDVSFEWGITMAYGQETPWLSGYGSGVMFWSLIYPLAPGVAYHFRARFRNRYGVFYGVDMAFATLSAQGIAVLIDDAALLRFLEVV